MKKLMLSIFLVTSFVFTSILGNFATVYASDSENKTDSQQTLIVLQGGYEGKLVGPTTDGRPQYQVDFGAPTYCDDLKTRIDTHWYKQKDGSFKSGDNQFSSSVFNEQITITKDKENITWRPTLSLVGADQGRDLIVNPQDAKPEILDIDPLNENYKRNTLIWHYDNGIERCLRLIEAQCQEYYILNKPIENDLVIDPHAVQTEGFIWYEKAIAYDNIGTNIQLNEDSHKIITLKAESIIESSVIKDKTQSSKLSYKEEITKAQLLDIAEGKEPEVMYPVVIDPNYTFTTSAYDGYVGYQQSPYTWSAAHNAATSSTGKLNTSSLYNKIMVWSVFSNHRTIYRSALYFDTSSLNGCIVNSAELRLRFEGGSADINDPFDIVATNGNPTYPHIPLRSSDYYYARYSGNGGTLSCTNGMIDQYYTLNLNATGLPWINKTGTTKIFLKEYDHDYLNINPPNRDNDANHADFYSYEKGDGYRPELIVTIIPPTVGAFWVSNYTYQTYLPYSNLCASYFRDVLVDCGWDQAFYIGDEGPVTQSDFQADIPDDANIFWFSGHGNTGRLILQNGFCVVINGVEYWSDTVAYSDVEWGDVANKWVFLHACHTLLNDNYDDLDGYKFNGKFAQSLNGTHLICGATTEMWDIPSDGTNVANHLTGSDDAPVCSVKWAWFNGIDVSNGSNVTLRIIGENSDCSMDYIYGEGTGTIDDPSVDGGFYSWDYTCED